MQLKMCEVSDPEIPNTETPETTLLFPTTDRQLVKIIIGVSIGLSIAAIILVIIGLSQNSLFVAVATATPTKTSTSPATATATATNTATATENPTATSTTAPTKTPTSIPIATPTATNTPIPPTETFTPSPPPPTETPTMVIAATVALTQSPIITLSPTIAVTLALSQTSPVTGTQVITPVGTPTPSPTPVPRTVLVPTDLPDYTQAQDHFWFTRPFTNAFQTWGSYYYPFGTNGRSQYLWHHGIDIQNPHGTHIVAIGNGTVVHARPDTEKLLGPWPDFFGQAVMLRHNQEWAGLPVYSLYGHVSKFLVEEGEQVTTGQPIAEVGQLGVALGPHLHLEIRVGGDEYLDTRNPDFWVRPDRGFGVIAGRVIDYQNYFVPQQLVTLHRATDPSRFWRQTFTYPDGEFLFDEQYGETFTFSDIPAGRYLLKTFFDGRQLTHPITVTNRTTSFALLQQELPPPTPKPVETPTFTPEVTPPSASEGG